MGAASVFVSLSAALYGGGGGAVAGLAGTYSLLLPAYLAHLAKCRADLDLQLASVQRLHTDTNIPQEDYRDDCKAILFSFFVLDVEFTLYSSST